MNYSKGICEAVICIEEYKQKRNALVFFVTSRQICVVVLLLMTVCDQINKIKEEINLMFAFSAPENEISNFDC